MERQKSSSQPEATLVTLHNAYQSVAAEIVAAGGELTPETETLLDRTITALTEKVDGYGIVLEQLEAGAEFWKLQAQKCTTAKKTFENAIERLRDRMKYVLRQLPDRSVQGTFYRFFLAGTRDTIEIDDAALPEQWKMTEYRLVPDRERIEAAVRAGTEIPGVTVKTDNVALRQGRPK